MGRAAGAVPRSRATQRPPSSARGVHHLALLSSDVEPTIRFYQDLLEFPLTELFENRDYQGSTHFFFDIGHGNLLAFFDFPGLDLGDVRRGARRSAPPRHLGRRPTGGSTCGRSSTRRACRRSTMSGSSLYFTGPDGERLELIKDPLGEMYGTKVV